MQSLFYDEYFKRKSMPECGEDKMDDHWKSKSNLLTIGGAGFEKVKTVKYLRVQINERLIMSLKR